MQHNAHFILFQLITSINMIYSSRLHTRGQIQKSGFGSLKGSHVLLFFLFVDCFKLSILNWICFCCPVIQYNPTFHGFTVNFQFYCSGSYFTVSEHPCPSIWLMVLVQGDWLHHFIIPSPFSQFTYFFWTLTLLHFSRKGE